MNKARPPVLVAAILVLLLPGLALAATAEPSRPMTLAEAQSLAVAYFQTIGMAREQAEQARQAQRLADSGRLPTVVTQAVYTRNLITAEFMFNDMRISILPPNDYNLVVSAVQPIFTGFRVERGRQQATLGVQAAGLGVDVAIQDTMLEATRAFYTLLAARENVEISRRAIQVAEETLRTAESLFRAGETVESSVLRSRVAVAGARRDLVDAENARELARQQLALVTGVTGDVEPIRPATPALPSADVDDLVKRGLAERLELRALDLQHKVATLEIDRRRGERLPSVQAQATYLKRKAAFPSSQNASASVSASLTVFDGGRIAAGVATAVAGLRESDLRRDLLRRQTEEQIRAIYTTIGSLRSAVDTLRTQNEFAKRNADEVSRAYRAGEATDLEVLDANASAVRAERQLAMATYQLELATYQLDRATGALGTGLTTAEAGGQ